MLVELLLVLLVGLSLLLLLLLGSLLILVVGLLSLLGSVLLSLLAKLVLVGLTTFWGLIGLASVSKVLGVLLGLILLARGALLLLLLSFWCLAIDLFLGWLWRLCGMNVALVNGAGNLGL